MEVGEYVKVKEWNVIGRILKVTGRKVYIDSLGFGLNFEQIQEHSKNIIDLIKVGDYVNGHKIEEIWEDADNYRLAGCNYMFEITEKEIKTIVTKEQFASIEYKLEDK